MAGVIALLEKPNLTQEDVLDYLNGKPLPSKPKSLDEQRFMERRKEIVELASQIHSGGAQIDANHRLVPNRGPEPLPDVPQQAPVNQHPVAPFIVGALDLLENEEAERQLIEREDRQAAESIARAVQRYRDKGVPEEDFVLIPIPQQRRHDTVNLTFRRICFAVLAVVTAFVCIMLQTLPLFTTIKPSDAIFDKLMPELLHVRDFVHHARYCRDLHRDRDSFRHVVVGNASPVDCSDGVLHIPAVRVLRHNYQRRSPNSEAGLILEPYANGVNVSWIMPCDTPVVERECQVDSETCFRGVHDGWVPDDDVESAIRLGADLIYRGGDHFDIYDNVAVLHARLPHLVQRVRNVLGQYNSSLLEPVAFRVNVALPMDATDVKGEKSSKFLAQTINKSNYIHWLEDTKRHNLDVLYAAFGPKPIRDTCNLLADTEANASYAVHTSIFLSDGAGADYQGGATLYADEYRRRRRVRRGVSIDGSRGRVVVSTGGRENQRCRLPTRAGIRAVLQIWWNEPSCAADMRSSHDKQEQEL